MVLQVFVIKKSVIKVFLSCIFLEKMSGILYTQKFENKDV